MWGQEREGSPSEALRLHLQHEQDPANHPVALSARNLSYKLKQEFHQNYQALGAIHVTVPLALAEPRS